MDVRELIAWRPSCGELTAPLNTRAPSVFTFDASSIESFDEETRRHLWRCIFAVSAFAQGHVFEITVEDPSDLIHALADIEPSDLRSILLSNTGSFDDGVKSVENSSEPDWPPSNIALGLAITCQSQLDDVALMARWREAPVSSRFLSALPLKTPLTITVPMACPDCCGSGRLVFDDSVDDPEWHLPCPTCCGDDHGRPGFLYRPIEGLDGILVGGSFDKDAPALYVDWTRDLLQECLNNDLFFRFEGWGAWVPHTGEESLNDGMVACRHGHVCEDSDRLRMRACPDCEDQPWQPVEPGRDHIRQRVLRGQIWDGGPFSVETFRSERGERVDTDDTAHSLYKLVRLYAERRSRSVDSRSISPTVAALMLDAFASGVGVSANHFLGNGASRLISAYAEKDIRAIDPSYGAFLQKLTTAADMFDIGEVPSGEPADEGAVNIDQEPAIDSAEPELGLSENAPDDSDESRWTEAEVAEDESPPF